MRTGPITVSELEEARTALMNKADRATAKATEITTLLVDADVVEGDVEFELPRHIEKYVMNRRKSPGMED